MLCWRDPRPPIADLTFDELAELYPEAIFRTAGEAMAAADLHYWDATIVWRLPCGAFVWTPIVDTCIRVDGNCVSLRDLWRGRNTDPSPVEVCSRDTADSGWD